MQVNTATKILALALTTLVVGTGIAQAQAVKTTRTLGVTYTSIGCEVAGQPVEFPNDLWLTNKTQVTIAMGARLVWEVPSMNYKGGYRLRADLNPGQSIFLADILPGGVEAGRPCRVSIQK